MDAPFRAGACPDRAPRRDQASRVARGDVGALSGLPAARVAGVRTRPGCVSVIGRVARDGRLDGGDPGCVDAGREPWLAQMLLGVAVQVVLLRGRGPQDASRRDSEAADAYASVSWNAQ